jgi:hypothetical protein
MDCAGVREGLLERYLGSLVEPSGLVRFRPLLGLGHEGAGFVVFKDFISLLVFGK